MTLTAIKLGTETNLDTILSGRVPYKQRFNVMHWSDNIPLLFDYWDLGKGDSIRVVRKTYSSENQATVVTKIMAKLCERGFSVPFFRQQDNFVETGYITGFNLADFNMIANKVLITSGSLKSAEYGQDMTTLLRKELEDLSLVNFEGIGERQIYSYGDKFKQMMNGFSNFLSVNLTEFKTELNDFNEYVSSLEANSTQTFRDASPRNYQVSLQHLCDSLRMNFHKNENNNDFIWNLWTEFRAHVKEWNINDYERCARIADTKTRAQPNQYNDSEFSKIIITGILRRVKEGQYNMEKFTTLLSSGLTHIDTDSCLYLVSPGTDEHHFTNFSQRWTGGFFTQTEPNLPQNDLERLNQAYWNLRWAYKTVTIDVKNLLENGQSDKAIIYMDTASAHFGKATQLIEQINDPRAKKIISLFKEFYNSSIDFNKIADPIKLEPLQDKLNQGGLQWHPYISTMIY